MQAKLKTVGELIGLAFQVRDDVLDMTASFEEIGKTPQKDLQAEKSTYPALLGLEEAVAFCNQTLDQANAKLEEIAQQVPFEIRIDCKSSRKFENQWLRKEWMY